MSTDLESPRSQALRYISASHFHRLFKHGDLTTSYADIGVPSDTTILFMPGMFASRYLAVSMHAVAESLGVRVLIVDRPGMGASTPVPLEKRVSVWIDLVPRLLAHLNIPHVALASHSAGMIYLLNTLFHCRELLHPERPRITSMQMAQFLPTRVFSIWNQIPKFLLLTATPVLESSGTIVNKVSSVSGTAPSGASSAQAERNRDRVESEHGLLKEVQKELEPLTWRFMFEENTQGANDEALQCLCKGPAGSWGICEDYEGGGFEDVVDFETAVIPGTDHNTVSQEIGLLERIFLEAGGRWSAGDNGR
ncbi:hypothetical protein N8T08_001407 [Aspergillus melleus]|uniref:Uncharacterized protein n=1 Tax=Aspergillus melleus TaxID=138277 RepID=A0ACC3B9Z0_9EURO|nr:hypothetical protein N8T08_001407 [Aspergillus melleus]